MTNSYGLDVSYFEGKLNIVLRDIKNYTPDELARELARYSVAADKTVILEPEFNNQQAARIDELEKGLSNFRDYMHDQAQTSFDSDGCYMLEDDCEMPVIYLSDIQAAIDDYTAPVTQGEEANNPYIKKAFWAGFELAKCFPDRFNILEFWTEWHDREFPQPPQGESNQ